MRSFIAAAALAATAFLGAEQASAVSLELTQVTPDPIAVGDQVVLQLSTSSDFPSFFGFEVSLDYDASALQLDSIGLDTGDFPFNAIPAVPVGASGATTVSGIEGGSLFDTFSGATDLLLLSFTALGNGTSDVSVITSDNEFLADGNILAFSGGVTTSVKVGNVGAVPLPATALLLLGGLGALSVLRARRSA